MPIAYPIRGLTASRLRKSILDCLRPLLRLAAFLFAEVLRYFQRHRDEQRTCPSHVLTGARAREGSQRGWLAVSKDPRFRALACFRRDCGGAGRLLGTVPQGLKGHLLPPSHALVQAGRYQEPPGQKHTAYQYWSDSKWGVAAANLPKCAMDSPFPPFPSRTSQRMRLWLLYGHRCASRSSIILLTHEPPPPPPPPPHSSPAHQEPGQTEAPVSTNSRPSNPGSHHASAKGGRVPGSPRSAAICHIPNRAHLCGSGSPLGTGSSSAQLRPPDPLPVFFTAAELEEVMRATLGALASFNADERAILLKVLPRIVSLSCLLHELRPPAPHGSGCHWD